MDSDVKVCPECGAEYFAHIRMCAGCEVELVAPGQEPPKRETPQGEGSLVCIEEGPVDRVRELSEGLKKAGVEFQVLKNMPGRGCKSSGGGYGIYVDIAIARVAAQALEDHIQKMYPELRESEARMEAGLCPACGADLKNMKNGECPDCGLNLWADPGGMDSCGGGGCGPC